MTGSPATRSRAALRSLLVLAWPIVIARATQSVIGFCDALMVAPLGEEALAAVTTGALDAFALIMLPMGTVFIVQSFVAQLRGRGELSAAPRYAWYGLAIALLAQLCALAVLPLAPHLLALLGHGGRVHEAMTTYLVIRLLSVFPAVAIEALGNWYGGLGDTRPALHAGVVAMVLNVAGNALLIEPRLGLPGYGVAGAAWASTLSSWAGFGVLAARAAPALRRAASERGLELRMDELLRTLRFGLPNGMNWFLEFSAFLLFINVVVGHLGTSVLAAFNVVLQLNGIAFMPAFGLASAGAILVGEAIGRRAHHEVWELVKLTGQIAGAWMGTIALVYVFAGPELMSLFRPRDTEAETLVGVGATMLAYAALWQLFDAVGMTLGEALRAAGDTTWCMLARVVLAWLVFTPVAWAAVLWLHGGVHAVMTTLVGYMVLLALALGARFGSGKWRTIDLVGEPAP